MSESSFLFQKEVQMTYAQRMSNLAIKLQLSGLTEYQQSLINELMELNVNEQKKALKALVQNSLGGNIRKVNTELKNVLH